jgi:hypothetical protein
MTEIDGRTNDVGNHPRGALCFGLRPFSSANWITFPENTRPVPASRNHDRFELGRASQPRLVRRCSDRSRGSPERMTYEDDSSASAGIPTLVMLRSNLAIGCVEPHPDKRSARGRRACRIGRRLALYGQFYG